MKRLLATLFSICCAITIANAQETVTIKLNIDGSGGTKSIKSLDTQESDPARLTVTKGTLVELSGAVADERANEKKFAFFLKGKTYSNGGTIVSNLNPYRFIAEESATYYIRYADIDEDLTANVNVSAAEGGYITGAIYGHIYSLGEAFSYRAFAKEGFTFTGWTDANGNIVCEDASFSGIITEKEVTYTANFESTTGVEEIKGEEETEKAIYDLSGRAIKNTTKGINIVNGKKILVK